VLREGVFSAGLGEYRRVLLNFNAKLRQSWLRVAEHSRQSIAVKKAFDDSTWRVRRRGGWIGASENGD